MAFQVGILTASDKGFAGEREDRSGPLIAQIMKGNGYEVIRQTIVPDEQELLAAEMIAMCDAGADLILTTGGTGFSKRDVTPEATRQVIEREAAGITNAILYASLQITPKAMLSRATAGIRGKTLIINLPGSPKAVSEALDIIIQPLEHGLSIMLGLDSECAEKLPAGS